jgi:hypothetical protein
MIRRPPRIVIQSMARNPSLYHAPESSRLANHGDFFNTYGRISLIAREIDTRDGRISVLDGTRKTAV